MNDQNENVNGTTVEANGTTDGEAEGIVNSASTVYATADEAQANKPASEKYHLIPVNRPNGEKVYVWATYKPMALAAVARADGYSCDSARKSPRDKVREALGNMSDEEKVKLLAELGIKVQPPRKPKNKGE